jgi:hypothetical protein
VAGVGPTATIAPSYSAFAQLARLMADLA